MKALFGVVSLLVVLALVGIIAAKQLKAVGHVGQPAPSSASTNADVPAVPSMAGSGTVKERAVGLENKVVSDMTNAMNQGAARDADAAEKAGSDK